MTAALWVIAVLAAYVIALGPLIALLVIQKERIRELERGLAELDSGNLPS